MHDNFAQQAIPAKQADPFIFQTAHRGYGCSSERKMCATASEAEVRIQVKANNTCMAKQHGNVFAKGHKEQLRRTENCHYGKARERLRERNRTFMANKKGRFCDEHRWVWRAASGTKKRLKVQHALKLATKKTEHAVAAPAPSNMKVLAGLLVRPAFQKCG